MSGNPVVLITGALSGIGRAAAFAFARDKARVVVSGRRAEEGRTLAAELVALGAEAQFIQADVRIEEEVRNLVDGTVGGVRHGPADVIQRLEKGEEVDPASYYFRIGPTFEAPAGKYAWLNGIIAVGIWHRFSYGPAYSVFEVL